MVIDMLEAVYQMLDFDKSAPSIEKVECSRIILAKVIEGMKRENYVIKESNAPVEVNPIKKKTPNNAPPITVSPPRDGEYPIVLNDDKTIREIQGLPFDALVELDGIQMTHKDAIGMTFTTGRIL
jgi:hypothetical protein